MPWVPQVGPAITAMVVRGLVQSGRPLTDPAVRKGLDFIETSHQKDGGYYKDYNPNYNSAVVLSMFAALPDTSDKHQQTIASLQNFLKSLQQDETKKDDKGNVITKDNPWYGGSGYGEDRPDLSNTAFMIEALHESGLPANDPAIQKAMIFVSRSQMNGETNSPPLRQGRHRRRLHLHPRQRRRIQIRRHRPPQRRRFPAPQLRLHDLLRLQKHSVVRRPDPKRPPRQSCREMEIQGNWSLDYNPGFRVSLLSDGQYYFLHAFAKAMYAWGQESVTDSKGVKHNWRAELVDTLTHNQSPDGSWVNPKSPRWFEGNPVLVTAYSVLCLQEARNKEPARISEPRPSRKRPRRESTRSLQSLPNGRGSDFYAGS